MARSSRAFRPNLLNAPAAIATAAATGALACLFVPGGWLDVFAQWAGMAAPVPAAALPLGWATRGLLGFAGGAGLGLVAWAVPVAGKACVTRLSRRGAGPDGVPAVRRADRHPDAPPRAPILAARDFGPVPDRARDPGTPLAGLAAPARTVPLAPGERIASVELTPDTREEPASLEALLARLERSASPARAAALPD